MMKTYYRRNLPHVHPVGAIFFVTFRLQGSLPLEYLEKIKSELDTRIFEVKTSKWLNPKAEIYKHQKLFFKKYDTALDLVYGGKQCLKEKAVAQVVANKIRQYDGKLYSLLCYCIMPNHVHLVIDTSIQNDNNKNEENYVQLDRILGLIKGGSSYEINKILKRSGQFWQRESYDHYVRSAKELKSIIEYVIQNPVKAKLVEDWTDYEFTFLS